MGYPKDEDFEEARRNRTPPSERAPLPDLPDLPAGVYQHYKGPLYQVLGYGHDANDDGRLVVIYIGIQLQGRHVGPHLATRTAMSDLLDVDAFFDFVHPVDESNERPAGSKCLDYHCPCKQRVRRFSYIGPGITEAQLANIKP